MDRDLSQEPVSGDRLQDASVSVTASIYDAMLGLGRGAVGIVLVLDTFRRLVGTVTDGDVRRALLSGASLESPLAPYVHRQFTSVLPGASRAAVLDLMQARTISQIPIVDRDGKLVGLHLLHELVGSVERQNWAVIMAGGKGTRLRPITEQIPKPMVTVAGRPILERLVLHLVGSGFRKIFLSINYLGHVVEEHFGNGEKFGCDIEYLRETKPLGTGGALALLPERPAVPFIVINGDLVTQADLGSLLNFHETGKHIATLGVRQYRHTVPFGCVEAQDGRVAHFEEKPVLSRRINTGIYALNPELLERIPLDRDFPVTHLFEECLARNESVGCYEVEDDWIDVGQREQLKIAREGAA
jgi:dTDP-glucose pyrophosphorylase/CBS domain-containing protein